MIPKSLSATAAAAFENCPARWAAEFFNKAPQPSNDAANLGTAVHGALELFVKSGGEPQKGTGQQAILEQLFFDQYDELFTDNSRKTEGLDMVRTWYNRTSFVDHVVVSTEKKDHFDIPTSAGPIPFNYIWDRCDILDGPWNAEGETRIEVIDYKTVTRPISPEGLKDKIQARCYGLAAQLQYPMADKVWVTFDLLRYEPVGIVFSKEDNRATWRYLKALAERVIALDDSEPLPERLNSECHWCVRRHECETLQANTDAGGVLASKDPKLVATKRHKLALQLKALDRVVQELDNYLLDWAEREELLEFDTDELRVLVTARKTRAVDSRKAAEIVGPGLLEEYGSLGVTAIDRMVKEGAVTPAQKAELLDLITSKFGEPKISTIEKNPIDSSI